MRKLLLGWAALAAAAPAQQSTSLVPTEGPLAAADQGEADILPFIDRNDKMLVDVAVTGQGPFPFMVDSGAERTVIARELANQLTLSAGTPVIVHSMTEARTVRTAHIPELRFSRKTVRNIHAPSLPATHLGAAGVLGVDSLQQQRVLFDFEKKQMTITASSKLNDLDNDGPTSESVVVNGRSLRGRLVLTEAAIGKHEVLAIVDTGSPITIANEALRNRLAPGVRLGPTSSVELVSVTGGTVTIAYGPVGSAKIGRLNIQGMSMGFGDVHPFRALGLEKRPAILLGMDVLRQFRRVTVDFPRRQVKFEMPRESGPRDS